MGVYNRRSVGKNIRCCSGKNKNYTNETLAKKYNVAQRS